MVRIGEKTAVSVLFERLQVRKEWEAAHPEFAADWTEAQRLDAEFDEELARQKQRDVIREDLVFQLSKVGVPKRAASALLRPDEYKDSYIAAHKWACSRHYGGRNGRVMLVLLGGAGTGKTVAAAKAAWMWLEAEIDHGARPTTAIARDVVTWVASAELATLSDFNEPQRAWFERMEGARLLVIDDVGAESMTQFALARFERLIDARYGSNRSTVLTSNCTPATLKERLGARIADRIREAGTVVNCGAQSMRRTDERPLMSP